jgi:hypothetical protein
MKALEDLPRGKKPAVPTDEEVDEPQNCSWHFGERIRGIQREEINLKTINELRNKDKTEAVLLGYKLKCKCMAKASLFVRAQGFRRFEFYKDETSTKK